MKKVFSALICLSVCFGVAVTKASADIPETSQDTFSKDVLESKEPVLVDFYTTWCGPCKAMHPILEKFAREHEGKVKVFQMDVDKNKQFGDKNGISMFPTFGVYVAGKLAKSQSGTLSEKGLSHLLTMAGVQGLN
jgi:thioredoxin 1